jgi:hypothetical protein
MKGQPQQILGRSDQLIHQFFQVTPKYRLLSRSLPKQRNYCKTSLKSNSQDYTLLCVIRNNTHLSYQQQRQARHHRHQRHQRREYARVQHQELVATSAHTHHAAYLCRPITVLRLQSRGLGLRIDFRPPNSMLTKNQDDLSTDQELTPLRVRY